MAQDPRLVRELAGGEIRVWVEQGQSICMRAVTKEGDPVELNAEEVRELIQCLEELAALTDD